MQYDFKQMAVDEEALEKAGEGDVQSLVHAFSWVCTPQRTWFWIDMVNGDIPLDKELLSDMLEQYKEWKNQNA